MEAPNDHGCSQESQLECERPVEEEVRDPPSVGGRNVDPAELRGGEGVEPVDAARDGIQAQVQEDPGVSTPGERDALLATADLIDREALRL